MMRKLLICLPLLLFATASFADIPKIFHVIKASIKTNNKNYVSYALIIGEFAFHDDSLLHEYKSNPKEFTKIIQNRRRQDNYDSLSLYAQIFKIKNQDVVLLPEDRETKIAWKDVKEIDLIEYLSGYYTGPLVYSETISSDSVWLTWKVTYTEQVKDESGMCYYTALYFNKPDTVSKRVVKAAPHMISKFHTGELSEKERIQFRKRLRKLRIVIFGMCSC
jgi:hypothetical protein